MSQSEGAIKGKPQFTWTAQERDEWLDLFRGSRQSVTQFCHESGLPPAMLSLWLNQRALSEARAVFESEFVEIKPSALPAPAASMTAAAVVTVHLPSGARIEVSASADAAWVGQLLRTLAPTGGAACLA